MTDSLHQLRPVTLDFVERAPHRFEYREPVAAPPATVFAAISRAPVDLDLVPRRVRGDVRR